MPSNISGNNKLLVVSDTGMVVNSNGEIKAFGPVVKELNNLLTVFDEITWIGFERKQQINNKSYIHIDDYRIKPLLLKEVGGKNFFSKLKIVLSYPYMIYAILSKVFNHKYIHSRAPSNPSVIIIFLSFFFKSKIFWHKYAGSWIDEASFFYKFQRYLLTKLNRNSIITINGNFSSKKNIISFENPCLDKKDRKKGALMLKSKSITGKINFCFVGALNEHKGVPKIIDAFLNIKSDKIGDIHFVGDGIKKEEYIEKSKQVSFNIIFHGYLPKDSIQEIYGKSHFILLPSKSEGFPKVIGEAMNYGCIPMVSNVSCISDYIVHKENGYLLEKPFLDNLVMSIKESLLLENEIYLKWINSNFEIAKKFTYSFYNYKVKDEVFKIK